MLRIQRVSILLFVSLFCITIVRSQRVAIRNNLMYDAALSPNFGMELRLDSTWTVGMNVGFNLWDYNKAKNQKWRHIMVSPYLRHYNKEMFRRSFWGIHAVYSHYNVGNVKFPFGLYKEVRDKRRQGPRCHRRQLGLQLVAHGASAHRGRDRHGAGLHMVQGI